MFYLNFRRERDRYDRDRERDKQRDRDRERGRDDRDRRAGGRGGAEDIRKRELMDTDDIGNNETLERLKKRRMELEADEVNFSTFRTFCSYYHIFCFRPTPNSIPAELECLTLVAIVTMRPSIVSLNFFSLILILKHQILFLNSLNF